MGWIIMVVLRAMLLWMAGTFAFEIFGVIPAVDNLVPLFGVSLSLAVYRELDSYIGD